MPRTYVYTQYGGPEKQTFLDLPDLFPGPGQLRVSVRAAGVNPADWKRRSGMMARGAALAEPTGLGLEVAGVVDALGEGVEDFVVGDEVFGSVVGGGGFAHESLLAVWSTAHKPAGVSFKDAATLPVAAATAYDGIEQLALERGQTLVVTGAGGGVGVAAVQIAVARGWTVIGTASKSKKELVESLGAMHVPYGPGTAERVRVVATRGLDALYDLVGGQTLRELAELVADKSKIISAGDAATAGELGGGPVDRKRNGEVLKAVAKLVDDRTLDPCVRAVFTLERAREALALVEAGHATGKVVVEIA
jgi:NADPH:quinone reductase-like Zn-dependent oxidoreductase